MTSYSEIPPVHRAAATKSTRYALNAVNLRRDADGIIAEATDGRACVQARVPADAVVGLGAEPVLVAAKAWAAFTKGKRVQVRRLELDATGATVVRDGTSERFDAPEARVFPDCGAVFPTDAPRAVFGLNATILADLQAALCDPASKVQCVAMTYYGPNLPLTIDGGARGRAAIMPVQTGQELDETRDDALADALTLARAIAEAPASLNVPETYRTRAADIVARFDGPKAETAPEDCAA